jgi:hypothetical protein
LPRPTLSHVSETHTRWREGSALAHISVKRNTVPIGTSFSFQLNEAASVGLTFTEQPPGRKVGKQCLALSKSNQSRRRCTGIVAGTLIFHARAGSNAVRFDGVLSRRDRLRPGRYSVSLTASASGTRSAPSILHFVIAKT